MTKTLEYENFKLEIWFMQGSFLIQKNGFQEKLLKHLAHYHLKLSWNRIRELSADILIISSQDRRQSLQNTWNHLLANNQMIGRISLIYLRQLITMMRSYLILNLNLLLYVDHLESLIPQIILDTHRLSLSRRGGV